MLRSTGLALQKSTSRRGHPRISRGSRRRCWEAIERLRPAGRPCRSVGPKGPDEGRPAPVGARTAHRPHGVRSGRLALRPELTRPTRSQRLLAGRAMVRCLPTSGRTVPTRYVLSSSSGLVGVIEFLGCVHRPASRPIVGRLLDDVCEGGSARHSRSEVTADVKAGQLLAQGRERPGVAWPPTVPSYAHGLAVHRARAKLPVPRGVRSASSVGL